jgi:hypothetical protein
LRDFVGAKALDGIETDVAPNWKNCRAKTIENEIRIDCPKGLRNWMKKAVK